MILFRERGTKLSGGQQQRVSIAEQFIEPEIIILIKSHKYFGSRNREKNYDKFSF